MVVRRLGRNLAKRRKVCMAEVKEARRMRPERRKERWRAGRGWLRGGERWVVRRERAWVRGSAVLVGC